MRPDPGSITALRPLGRNLALDLTGAIGIGITATVAGVFLPTIARRGGLEPVGLAALAVGPYLGIMLSAFAGRVGPRSARQLAVLRGVGAGLLLAIPLAPSSTVIIATSLLFWFSLGFGGPFQVRLWGGLYPGRLRGRIIGLLGTGRSAAALLAALAGGFLADRIGGVNLVGLGGLLGVACALGYAGIRAPRTAAAAIDTPAYSARDSIRAIMRHRTLSRLMLAQTFFGGGMAAAAPLLALVNVDRLDLSLANVGILGVVGAVATTLSFLAWGAAADRFGSPVPLRLGSAIGLCGLVAYTLAPGVEALWAATAALGACNAAVELGILAAISEGTTLATRSPAQSGLNALLGVRALVAAFTMSALVQAGLVDLTGALLICCGLSAAGVVLFLLSGRPVRANPEPAAGRPVIAGEEPPPPASRSPGIVTLAGGSRVTEMTFHRARRDARAEAPGADPV